MSKDVTISSPPGTANSESHNIDDTSVSVWARTASGWKIHRLGDGEDMSIFDENGNHIAKVEVDGKD